MEAQSPAAQAALAQAITAELKASLIRLGAAFDWRRELKSHDPDYIKWSQYIFIKFFHAGLAYKAFPP